MLTNEQAAQRLVDDSRQVRRRLLFARSCLTREALRLLGRGVFDSANRRLVSDDGACALEWRLRRHPVEPESYRNQQTRVGVVCWVNLIDRRNQCGVLAIQKRRSRRHRTRDA
jgi:hypothetical protein